MGHARVMTRGRPVVALGKRFNCDGGGYVAVAPSFGVVVRTLVQLLSLPSLSFTVVVDEGGESKDG